MFFSLIPITDVDGPWLFAIKIIVFAAGANAIGVACISFVRSGLGTMLQRNKTGLQIYPVINPRAN